MNVKLLNVPDLTFVDSAIGQCYDKGCYTDPVKMHGRIDRVANGKVTKHDSVLEFTDAIFEITASTKVLLEMTRHRQASYACKSSRYTIDKGVVIFEPSGDEDVDSALALWRETVEEMIAAGKPNDVVSLMLPQAYQYRWTCKFNYRSLQNFMALRLDKHAHFQIRAVAEAMLASLPEEHRYLFKDQ